MTVGFPAALPPPLSSLRGEVGGCRMDGSQGRRALIFMIVVMSVKASDWPAAPLLFNNPIITSSIVIGDPSAAAAARLSKSIIHRMFVQKLRAQH